MEYKHSPSGQSLYGDPGGSPSVDQEGAHSGEDESPEDNQASKFDILQWYPQYQSCLRYFVEVSQHTYPCQALAAFINIRLPVQRSEGPPSAGKGSNSPGPSTLGASSRYRYPPGSTHTASPSLPHPTLSQYGWVSLHPYIRRLVATGFDVPAILHGWFGDDWVSGVGPLHEQERRNYLFAAKSGGWSAVKRGYDDVSDQAIPYLKPLMRVDDDEIEAAEGSWSKWLAMEDWMLGSRAPQVGDLEEMSN